MKFKDSHLKVVVIFILIGSLTLLSFKIQSVSAASLQSLSDVMTRIKVSELSSHDISFTLDSGTEWDADETITVDFDEDGGGFAVNGASSAIADFDVTTAAVERDIYNVGATTDCTGSVGSDDISVGINDTTGVVTLLACPSFTSSGSGDDINIEYGTAATDTGSGTNRVTNPGSAQNYLIDITAAGDTGKIAIDTELEDQISVTASIDPSISFSISSTSALNFSTLSTTLPTIVNGPTLAIGTNGSGGYTLYIYDAGNGSGSAGLYNSVAPYLIASATADLDAVDGGYGAICTEVLTPDGACQAPYNVAANNVGALQTTAQAFASYGSKPTGTDSYLLDLGAEAPAAADAGSYADTLTIIATAIF
ncbi:hypothetical protein ACFL14_02950 [Patescibacteria group bacterium]